MKTSDIATLGVLGLGAYFLLTRTGSSIPLQKSNIVATAGELKEATADKTRRGDSTPVTQQDVNNLRERQYTLKFQESQEQQIQNRLEQQQHDIARRQYERARQSASHRGGKDVDLITTVRRDGKIYVYRNGAFIGFQTGEEAIKYQQSFHSGKEPVAKSKAQVMRDRGYEPRGSGWAKSKSHTRVIPQTKDASGRTAFDRRVMSSPNYVGSRYSPA